MGASASLLLQMFYLYLGENLLTGTIPGLWNNLASVSPCRKTLRLLVDVAASLHLQALSGCTFFKAAVVSVEFVESWEVCAAWAPLCVSS